MQHAGMPRQRLLVFTALLMLSCICLFFDQGFVEKVERGRLNPHDCDATTYAFFSQVPEVGQSAWRPFTYSWCVNDSQFMWGSHKKCTQRVFVLPLVSPVNGRARTVAGCNVARRIYSEIDPIL